MLYQIIGPGFCAGVIVADGCITIAAPILNKTRGWHWDRFLMYCREMHYEVRRVL